MAALSDTIAASGIDILGRQATPHQSADRFVQSIQTSAAKVDNDIGVKRIQAAAALEGHARVIGGTSLQNYDSRLDQHKGNVLMVNALDPTGENTSGIGAYDGRPTVYASLAGMVVPDSVNNEWEWRMMNRPIGFAFYDHLISNAASGQAPHYGTAVITGGSLGSVPHVVPEDIGAGQLLVADIGPLDPDARAKWQANFKFNKTNHIEGSEKPVLRPYSPYGGIEFLGTAFEEFYALVNEGGSAWQEAYSPGRFGQNFTAPAAVAAAGMARPLMTAVWMGVALLAEAGYITIAPPGNPSSGNLFGFTSLDKSKAAVLATRLGLDGSNGMDLNLVKSIVGAFYQPLSDHTELAEMLSVEKALVNSALATQLQNEGAMALITTISDVNYMNTATIVAKAAHNSKQNNNGIPVVASQ